MKQIYLLKHAYVPNWVYVGATTCKSLKSHFGKHWSTNRLANNTKLAKALRCSERSDWSITQLHGFSENWSHWEPQYIRAFDSYHGGLNSTASGAPESTTAHKRNAVNQAKANSTKASKSVLCSNGAIYASTHEASRQTGVSQGQISASCRGLVKKPRKFTWNYV